MPLNTGMVVIIAAVLLFYLRLIVIQRERLKRLRAVPQARGKGKKKPAKESLRGGDVYVSLSILSTRPRDRVIAGAGLLAVIAGIMLNQHWIAWQTGQVYWWLPVALGIVAFSWAFR